MTDNEIIKALECCTKIGCSNCPLYAPEQTGTCVKRVMLSSLDFINRQKAEIEHWRSEAYKYQKFWSNSYNEQEVDEVIEKQPEADVAKVIRCKDCKYYIQCTCTHPYIRHFCDEDGYCSYAERR